MRFAMAGINHQPFEVGLVDPYLEQGFPDAAITPATKASMRILPVPIAWRQITPRRAGAQNPKDRIDEAAVVPGHATPLPRAAREVGFDQSPLAIGQVVAMLSGRHRASIDHKWLCPMKTYLVTTRPRAPFALSPPDIFCHW